MSTGSSLLASARFGRTVVDLRKMPRDGLPEVAFVGRSNAGKSTALNLLCQRKRLAFASRTPGRTQALNLFEVGPEDAPIGLLVDTPGYGFAAAPESVRSGWDRLVGRYLGDRQVLTGVVLMLDSRRGLGELDRKLLDWMPPGSDRLVLLTKADKLTHSERLALRRQITAELPGCDVLLFSALSRIGIDEARRWVTMRIDGAIPTPAPTPAHGQAGPAATDALPENPTR